MYINNGSIYDSPTDQDLASAGMSRAQWDSMGGGGTPGTGGIGSPANSAPIQQVQPTNGGNIDFTSMYESALGRAPDQAGLDYWNNQANLGMGAEALQEQFYRAAAKEVQGDYSGNLDPFDEYRIASSMAQAGQSGTTYQAYNQALNPTTYDMSAQDRLNAPQAPQQAQQAQQAAASGPTLTPYQKNLYLDEMAAGITSQMNDNWTRNLAPSIRSGAMAAGGFGGSRQGVVEANGLNDLNRSLGQNLSNLYGQDYTNSMNRNLQKYQADQGFSLGLGQLALGQQSQANSYDLGLRSSDLGFAGLDANINNSNFSNQLNAANFGMNAYNTMNGQTSTGIQAGTNVQNTPLDYQKYFTGSANSIGSGLASNTTSQTNSGNPYLGAMGGAMLGNQLQNSYNPYATK